MQTLLAIILILSIALMIGVLWNLILTKAGVKEVKRHAIQLGLDEDAHQKKVDDILRGE